MARLGVRALLALLLGPLPWLGPPARSPVAGEAAAAVAVVAHAGVPAPVLTRAEARRLFLLRQRFWSDGTPVRPINLPPTHPVREAFSQQVLGSPTRALIDYWNDQYFHGVRPPAVLQSEQAVLLYVARTRGAVGYVSRGAAELAVAGGEPVRVLLTVAD